MANRSIQRKLLLLILPFCLVPASVFLVLVGAGSRLTFEKTLGMELGERAVSYARQFDRFFSWSFIRFDGVVARYGADAATLAQAPGLGTSVEAVVWIDARGGMQVSPVVAGKNDSLVNQISRSASLFKEWWAARASIPARGMFTELEFLLAGQLAPMRCGVYVFHDRNDGLFFIVCDAGRLVESYLNLLAQRPEFLLVYSRALGPIYCTEPLQGAVASRIDASLAGGRSVAPWFTVDLKGDSFLFAPAPLQSMMRFPPVGRRAGAVWLVILRYDMENYLGPRDALIWTSLLVTAAVVVILMLLASLATRRLIRPLDLLRRQAEALAGGNLDVQVTVGTRDEIGDLGDAFNVMAARLRDSYRSLEARLQENRLRAEHIHVINEITNAIIQALSLDDIFKILLRDLGKILPFDACWLALFDRDGSDLRVTQIFPPVLVTRFDNGRIPTKGSLHARVVAGRETLRAEVSGAGPGEFVEISLLEGEGFKSYLVAPLPSRDRIIGTLTLASTAAAAYNGELARIMTSLAGAVSVAIEQADLFMKLTQFALELERKVAVSDRELAAATRKLSQTEKYFATGRMAGNLAHEINNPLGIIKNYLALVKNNLRRAEGGRRRTDPSLEQLAVIDEEVDRIARLVRQLLDLHRPVEQKVQPVDLNVLISDILKIMAPDLERDRIAVSARLDPDLPRPTASPDLIRQLL
ncbi:MAG: HAMP domain-containing protein, partial [bacterium]|nr:HAMP domain-containing protein [bacterium]